MFTEIVWKEIGTFCSVTIERIYFTNFAIKFMRHKRDATNSEKHTVDLNFKQKSEVSKLFASIKSGTDGS